MTFFVRPIIRPPANLYKNDGGGGAGPKFVYPEMAQYTYITFSYIPCRAWLDELDSSRVGMAPFLNFRPMMSSFPKCLEQILVPFFGTQAGSTFLITRLHLSQMSLGIEKKITPFPFRSTDHDLQPFTIQCFPPGIVLKILFMLQGLLQTVLGYKRVDNCMYGCATRMFVAQFMGSLIATVHSQLYTCLIGWEKYSFV